MDWNNLKFIHYNKNIHFIRKRNKAIYFFIMILIITSESINQINREILMSCIKDAQDLKLNIIFFTGTNLNVKDYGNEPRLYALVWTKSLFKNPSNIENAFENVKIKLEAVFGKKIECLKNSKINRLIYDFFECLT